MKPIVIWTPPYDLLSGGIMVLHRLCHELRELGQDAYINVAGSSGLNTPTWQGQTNDFTAIYPEIVFGNPLGASKVVRWVLNKPGKIGGPKSYDPSDLIFTYSKLFYDSPNLLFNIDLETDIFIDKHLERTYPLVYVGKGTNTPRVPETNGIREITRTNCLNKPELSDIFNHATVLYSYDVITAINDMARLSGCPVCLIPDNEYPKETYNPELGMNGFCWYGDDIKIDSDKFRKYYFKLKKECSLQLQHLIDTIND